MSAMFTKYLTENGTYYQSSLYPNFIPPLYGLIGMYDITELSLNVIILSSVDCSLKLNIQMIYETSNFV